MPLSALFHRTSGPALSAQLRSILRGVSRSFHLSIQLLPPVLQAPVAIGYLLARATDTVADTTALPVAQRQVLLDFMMQNIEAPKTTTEQIQELSELALAFATQQTDPQERALMQALPQCLALLHTLGQEDQSSVRHVLGHITHGQQLDMSRFGPGLNALQTEAELVDYTWLVAGCVGEFWTELCGRHLPGYSLLQQEKMMELGRSYGMGLQRLNIIRDAGADLESGRCYWPMETLAEAGLNPAKLAEVAQTGHSKTLNVLSPLFIEWLDDTQAHLVDGMRYALALKTMRLRLASALPALIGARTVTLLRQAGPAALNQRVKMPRHELRALLWRIALGLGSAAVLEKEFLQLSGEPPT